MIFQSKYAKAIIATIVAALGFLVAALGTSPQQNFSHLTTATWLIAIASFLGSGAVTWWVQNVQGVAGGIIKAVVSTGGAFITTLVTALNGQSGFGAITQAQWLTAITAALVALAATYQVKNAGT